LGRPPDPAAAAVGTALAVWPRVEAIGFRTALIESKLFRARAVLGVVACSGAREGVRRLREGRFLLTDRTRARMWRVTSGIDADEGAETPPEGTPFPLPPSPPPPVGRG